MLKKSNLSCIRPKYGQIQFIGSFFRTLTG